MQLLPVAVFAFLIYSALVYAYLNSQIQPIGDVFLLAHRPAKVTLPDDGPLFPSENRLPLISPLALRNKLQSMRVEMEIMRRGGLPFAAINAKGMSGPSSYVDRLSMLRFLTARKRELGTAIKALVQAHRPGEAARLQRTTDGWIAAFEDGVLGRRFPHPESKKAVAKSMKKPSLNKALIEGKKGKPGTEMQKMTATTTMNEKKDGSILLHSNSDTEEHESCEGATTTDSGAFGKCPRGANTGKGPRSRRGGEAKNARVGWSKGGR